MFVLDKVQFFIFESVYELVYLQIKFLKCLCLFESFFIFVFLCMSMQVFNGIFHRFAIVVVCSLTGFFVVSSQISSIISFIPQTHIYYFGSVDRFSFTVTATIKMVNLNPFTNISLSLLRGLKIFL